MHSDRVIVYRSEILPASETFILAQVRAMRRYQPCMLGLRRSEGLAVDGLRVRILESGKLGRLSEIAFRYASFGPALYRAAREHCPSLIHAHFATDAAECLPVVENLEVPLIATLHGFDVTMTDDAFRQFRRGRAFLSRRPRLQRTASLFLCVSEFIRSQALTKGFPAEKLVVHYIGVDTARIVAAPPQLRERTVLFVGRLVEKKGLTFLLRAMAFCRGMKLVVIGDGPLREQHEAEALQLNVNCQFLGAQPNDAVHQWMRRASVLAVPSVRAATGDSEGLPTVIIEAFASGLPVVAFSSAGIPEAVSETCGRLAEEREHEPLGRHLHSLLQNPDLLGRLSHGARQRAVEKFDLARQTEQLERIYDRVSGKPVPAGSPGLHLVAR